VILVLLVQGVKIFSTLGVFHKCSAAAEIIPLAEVTRDASRFVRNVKNK